VVLRDLHGAGGHRWPRNYRLRVVLRNGEEAVELIDAKYLRQLRDVTERIATLLQIRPEFAYGGMLNFKQRPIESSDWYRDTNWGELGSG
jgi:hypothetical protein